SRCCRVSSRPAGTGVAASHPHDDRRNPPSETRSRKGSQRDGPAAPLRIDGRAGARGQVLAMSALSLIALCALVGLAADTGYFFDCRRRMQTAADAAALAGAEQLRRGGSPVGKAGKDAATANGFTTDASTSVDVYAQPHSGY